MKVSINKIIRWLKSIQHKVFICALDNYNLLLYFHVLLTCFNLRVFQFYLIKTRSNDY
jgi:hypothetical protein